MSSEVTETTSKFSTSDIFNPNGLDTDDIIRIGREYAEEDTFHGNQYFTTMLLVGEIERLRKEMLDEEYWKAYERIRFEDMFESDCELYDALDSLP